VKYDQRSNLILGAGIVASVIVIIVFIAALLGSKYGEVAAAPATPIAGILALIASVLVYRAAMSSRRGAAAREGCSRHISAVELRIPRPKLLAELWENLSDPPPNALHEIRFIPSTSTARTHGD
jgi:hypothetical protein